MRPGNYRAIQHTCPGWSSHVRRASTKQQATLRLSVQKLAHGQGRLLSAVEKVIESSVKGDIVIFIYISIIYLYQLQRFPLLIVLKEVEKIVLHQAVALTLLL